MNTCKIYFSSIKSNILQCFFYFGANFIQQIRSFALTSWRAAKEKVILLPKVVGFFTAPFLHQVVNLNLYFSCAHIKKVLRPLSMFL